MPPAWSDWSWVTTAAPSASDPGGAQLARRGPSPGGPPSTRTAGARRRLQQDRVALADVEDRDPQPRRRSRGSRAPSRREGRPGEPGARGAATIAGTSRGRVPGRHVAEVPCRARRRAATRRRRASPAAIERRRRIESVERTNPPASMRTSQIGPARAAAPGGNLGDVGEQQGVQRVEGLDREAGDLAAPPRRASPATSPAPPRAAPAGWRAGSWSRARRSGRRSAARWRASRRSSSRLPRRARAASRPAAGQRRDRARAAAPRAGGSRARRRS